MAGTRPRPVLRRATDDETSMAMLKPFFVELDEDEIEAAEQLQPRQISDEQLRKFEGYVAEMFSAGHHAAAAWGSGVHRAPSPLC
jgi:hypothetical protein